MAASREKYKYQQGETVVLQIKYYTVGTTTLVDPDEVKITIYKPDGTKLVDDQATTKDGTGEYSYDNTLAVDAAEGDYKVRWRAKSGTRYKVDHDMFEVEI